MDPYVGFTAFFTRVTVRLGRDKTIEGMKNVVESELTELRLRDQYDWMRLYQHIGQITTPPGIGTVGQQVQAGRALMEYLQSSTKTMRPELILPVIVEANRHYHRNRDELLAAIEEYSLDGASDADIVEDFLRRLNTPPT